MLSNATRSTRMSVSEFAQIVDFRAFSTVVSAHSHSHHSREALADVPAYILRVPFVGRRPTGGNGGDGGQRRRAGSDDRDRTDHANPFSSTASSRIE